MVQTGLAVLQRVGVRIVTNNAGIVTLKLCIEVNKHVIIGKPLGTKFITEKGDSKSLNETSSA